MKIVLSELREWADWVRCFKEMSMDNERESGPRAMGGECRTMGPTSDGAAFDRATERIVKAAESLRGGLTLENVEEAFAYQSWDRAQQDCGAAVRDVLVMAAKTILRSVPPGRLRDRTLDCLVDARMLANAGITFRGRF